MGNIAETCKPSDQIFHRCGNEDGVSITREGGKKRLGERRKKKKIGFIRSFATALGAALDKFLRRRAKARREVKFSRDRVVKSLKNGRGTCRRDESGTRPGTTRRGALVARRKGAEARGPGRLIIGLTLNFCNKCRHPASREGNGPPQHRKRRKQLVGSRKKKKRGDKRGDSRPRPS